MRSRLSLESLESREVPATLAHDAFALVHNGPTSATVDLVTPNNVSLLPTFTPFPGFRGAVTAATGDVNGDGNADVIVAAQGADGLVEVIDGAGRGVLAAGAVFPGFTGAVGVGAADVNGDGFAEILLAAGGINTPVYAYSLHDGALVAGFFALPGYSGPISVTGADITGNGKAEIIVGLGGQGFGGAVGAFRADGSLLGGVFAFPGLTGGVSVAGGDVNGDGFPDIIVGGGPGAFGGEVKVFSGRNLNLINDFAPVSIGYRAGVFVGVGDANGDGRRDILLALQSDRPTGVWAFDGITGALLNFSPDTSTPVEL